MDIVGGAYGGADPRQELRLIAETAKSWLEGALGNWNDLTEENRLEMLAASLLSLNRLEMKFDELGAPGSPWGDVRLEAAPERPNLVDLSLDEDTGQATARVKLEFRNQSLVGESLCRSGLGRDHAAPARATLDALDDLLEDQLTLEDARVLQIVDGPFAVVTLRNEARLLVGSALIEADLGLAMARATLDAVNRFISGRRREEDRTIQLA